MRKSLVWRITWWLLWGDIAIAHQKTLTFRKHFVVLPTWYYIRQLRRTSSEMWHNKFSVVWKCQGMVRNCRKSPTTRAKFLDMMMKMMGSWWYMSASDTKPQKPDATSFCMQTFRSYCVPPEIVFLILIKNTIFAYRLFFITAFV